MYFAYVRSKLEYCSVVWAPGYGTYIDNLESVQRRFLKFLSFTSNGVYPAVGYPNDLLLKKFEMHSLFARRKLHSIIFLYKIISGQVNCTSLLVQLYFRVPRPASRNIDCFYLPYAHTNLLKFSPVYVMCSNYNSVCDLLDIFSCSVREIENCVCPPYV